MHTYTTHTRTHIRTYTYIDTYTHVRDTHAQTDSYYYIITLQCNAIQAKVAMCVLAIEVNNKSYNCTSMIMLLYTCSYIYAVM